MAILQNTYVTHAPEVVLGAMEMLKFGSQHVTVGSNSNAFLSETLKKYIIINLGCTNIVYYCLRLPCELFTMLRIKPLRGMHRGDVHKL